MNSSTSQPEGSAPKDTTILCPESDGRFKIDKHGKVKVPRRLIHCSDGILEEYSTDEEEEEPPPPPVDTGKLTWGPYFWYYSVRAAVGGLAACDYLGEKLAYFFGITSPKYQYAISEWERMQEEDKEQDELEQEERAAEEEIIRGAIPGEQKVTVIDPSNVKLESKEVPQFDNLAMSDES